MVIIQTDQKHGKKQLECIIFLTQYKKFTSTTHMAPAFHTQTGPKHKHNVKHGCSTYLLFDLGQIAEMYQKCIEEDQLLVYSTGNLLKQI
jgi:hypothetical protein